MYTHIFWTEQNKDPFSGFPVRHCSVHKHGLCGKIANVPNVVVPPRSFHVLTYQKLSIIHANSFFNYQVSTFSLEGDTHS